jgi:hypothetical protein
VAVGTCMSFVYSIFSWVAFISFRSALILSVHDWPLLWPLWI